jgi:hypothetical protein
MERVFRSGAKVVLVLLAAVTALAGCGVRQTPGTEDDDGRYFFFMAARTPLAGEGFELPTSAEGLLEIHSRPGHGLPDIWWVDAAFIEELRAAER